MQQQQTTSDPPDDKPQFSFRLPLRVLQALKIEAVKDNASYQEWVTRVITQELRRRGVNI